MADPFSLLGQRSAREPEFNQVHHEVKQDPDAGWTRITKCELQAGLALEDLMSDHADLFNNPAIVAEEEFEQEPIAKGGNPLDTLDRPEDDTELSVRRIETVRCSGPVTDENAPDGDAIDDDTPVADVALGALIGANRFAQPLFADDFNPAPEPVPAARAALGVMKHRQAWSVNRPRWRARHGRHPDVALLSKGSNPAADACAVTPTGRH